MYFLTVALTAEDSMEVALGAKLSWALVEVPKSSRDRAKLRTRRCMADSPWQKELRAERLCSRFGGAATAPKAMSVYVPAGIRSARARWSTPPSERLQKRQQRFLVRRFQFRKVFGGFFRFALVTLDGVAELDGRAVVH